MDPYTSDILYLYRKAGKHEEILEKLTQSCDSLQTTLQDFNKNMHEFRIEFDSFRTEVTKEFNEIRSKIIQNEENASSTNYISEEFQGLKNAKTMTRKAIKSLDSRVSDFESP